MPFPVLGSNSAVAEFAIDNSLRFNDDDSPALQFTPSSDSNEQTWTVSFWVKRSNLTTSSSQMIFCSDTNYNEYVFARFCGTEVSGSTDAFQVFMTEPNAREGNVRTNRLFRDVSAWYHIVVRCDLTQSTAADRLRIYVNGVKETSFHTATYLNQNDDNINWNSNVPQAIGHQKQAGTNERFFGGYLAEFYNIDGQSLAPTEFGETNDNGVWIPKAYSGSYGTNGFFLEFQNSGALGTDTSGNGNNFTPTNLTATDQTTDTPTNNFCTMNPIAADPNTTLAEGNLKWTSGGDGGVVGTMAVSNGKWYWECKGVDVGADSQLGIWQTSKDTGYPLNQYVGTGESWGYVTFSGKNIHSDSQSAAITAVSDNDIMMFALDMDNYKLWFGINGTWTQSGNPATGANANHTGITDEFMTPAIASYSGSSGYDWRFNFGNPIVSISSGNSDANGYGNFEYAVPSGFYSLCTKNLAEYG
jgi:hypothetical protein